MNYDLRKSVFADKYGQLTPAVKSLCLDVRGFPPNQIEIIRYGTNLVIRAGFQVFRIAPIERLEAINANLRTVKTLISAGAPVLRPLDNKAIVLDEHAVLTRWFRKKTLDKDVSISYAKLGSALKALHDTKVQNTEINIANIQPEENNRYNIVERFDSRLNALSASMPTQTRSNLDKLSEEAISLYEQAIKHTNCSDYILHGDASVTNSVDNGNTVVDNTASSALLIDLDGVCIGHREVDLGAVSMSTKRFGAPKHFDLLLKTYYETGKGDASIDLELIEVYTRIKEITSVTWLATLWDKRPESHNELEHRISTLLSKDDSVKWNRF